MFSIYLMIHTLWNCLLVFHMRSLVVLSIWVFTLKWGIRASDPTLKTLFTHLFILYVMGILPACMSLYHKCAWCFQRTKFGACHIDAGNQTWVPGRTACALSHQASSLVPHFLGLIWWGLNYFAID